METWGMPNEGKCDALELPHQLYCRRNDVVKSKIGVNRKSFDKAVGAELIESVVLPGETYARFYTAQVIQVLVK